MIGGRLVVGRCRYILVVRSARNAPRERLGWNLLRGRGLSHGLPANLHARASVFAAQQNPLQRIRIAARSNQNEVVRRPIQQRVQSIFGRRRPDVEKNRLLPRAGRQIDLRPRLLVNLINTSLRLARSEWMVNRPC